MSQKLQKTMERTRQHGGLTSIKSKASGTHGTSSTIAFTPVQGIEIINQQMPPPKSSGIKSTYFSASTTFFKH